MCAFRRPQQAAQIAKICAPTGHPSDKWNPTTERRISRDGRGPVVIAERDRDAGPAESERPMNQVSRQLACADHSLSCMPLAGFSVVIRQGDRYRMVLAGWRRVGHGEPGGGPGGEPTVKVGGVDQAELL